MPRPISAVISRAALTHNLLTVRRHLQQSTALQGGRMPAIWAVIKANAYGHGIEPAVQAFSGADGLAMLDFVEAVRAREAGWQGPLLMLEGCFEPRDLDLVTQYRLTLVVHGDMQLEMLQTIRVPRPIDVFVKLNSGMNRLGFSPEEYASAFERARALQSRGVLGSVGKMTHFARADDAVGTGPQMDVFRRVTAGLPGPVSVCNSAATWRDPPLATQSEAQDAWVRPGICLYGASPFEDLTAAGMGLMPAMTLRSRIIGVQSVPAGQAIGYGARFVAERPMRVGVVACGYADGYPRHAVDGTPVVVDGYRSRLLGRVSMDMMMVDLSDLPALGVGAPVVLWGQGGPDVDEVARHSGTIGYELLCAIAPRVPRLLAD